MIQKVRLFKGYVIRYSYHLVGWCVFKKYNEIFSEFVKGPYPTKQEAIRELRELENESD